MRRAPYNVGRMRGAGLTEFMLTRDIATLIREDGRSDPATSIDVNDSATPRAMPAAAPRARRAAAIAI